MNSHLVSIIIPVYNGANYLREAIDSALSQTYPHIEILVINDGANDNGATEAIAKSYGEKIKYFSKPNGGCASALNVGLTHMKGAYFSWLSHDDVYFKNKIAHQMQILAALETDKAQNLIIYGGYEIIDAQSKPLYQIKPETTLSNEKLNHNLQPLLNGLIHGCSLLIPKKYFDEHGFFNETLKSTQDYDLWFRIFRTAKLHYDSMVLIQSRVHPEQGTHTISNHLDECNKLWTGFLKALTPEEMSSMEGSPYRFVSKMKKFLVTNNYREAGELAERMMQDTLGMTKISVIIPFYNRIPLLIKAIESVRDQTHQNVEILIIDDGSTEDLSLVNHLVKVDNRIRYLRQHNSGPASARNYGIRNATGTYIAFLDSDDLFHPEKLEKQLYFMEKGLYDISHTSYITLNIDDKKENFIPSGKFNGRVFPKIMRSCPIATPTVMGLSSIFKKYPFPEKMMSGEDVCLWITITHHSNLGGMLEALTTVRIDNNSTAYHPEKLAKGLLNISQFLVNNSDFCAYGSHIRSLLKSTMLLLPSRSPSLGARDRFREFYYHYIDGGLFIKVVDCIRHQGIRATLNKIQSKLIKRFC